MKIIGITGDSGSGKTTFATYLSKNIKCKMIDIDKLILKSSLFNDFDVDANAPKLNDDNFKILTDNFEDENSLISSIINEIIEFEINKLSPDTDILVLEWMLLPFIKIWKQCNTKVLIESNEQERRKNAINNKLITKEKYDECFSIVKINYNQFKYNYIIQNNYDNESLNKILNVI